jgi:predicted alpha/beta hydrolase
MEKDIQYRDKTLNRLSVFSPDIPADTTFICLPAMGIRASYYKQFAAELSLHGYNVITADWRGHGNSSVRASRKIDFGYEDLVQDLKEVIDLVKTWFPDTKIILVGHSLGGQIGSLFASRYANVVSGLILIASCSVYTNGFDNWNRKRLHLAANLFSPLSKLFGHFPGTKIGFGGREAKRVMQDWCLNARTGTYNLTNSNHDYELSLSQMTLPVLSISLENDQLAPKRAVENLLNKFNRESSILHLHLTSSQTQISPLNHFSWAKNPEYFIRTIVNWINP